MKIKVTIDLVLLDHRGPVNHRHLVKSKHTSNFNVTFLQKSLSH